MAVLLKPALVRVSFIQIMQVRVQNKGKSVWKSRYVGDVSMSHEFNFAKFRRQPRDKESPSKDEIIGLASIAVPPNDPLE